MVASRLAFTAFALGFAVAGVAELGLGERLSAVGHDTTSRLNRRFPISGKILVQKSEEKPEEPVVSRAPPPDGSGLEKNTQPNPGNPFQTLGSMLDSLSNGKASGLGGNLKDIGSVQSAAQPPVPKAPAGAGKGGSAANAGNPFQTLGSVLDDLAKGGKLPDPPSRQDEEDGVEDSGPPIGELGAALPSAQGGRPGALQSTAGAKGMGGKGGVASAAGKGGWSPRLPKQLQTPYPYSPYPYSPYGPWPDNCRGGRCGPSYRRQSAVTVSVRGINIRCRKYPDNFITDGNNLAHFSSPSRLDAICWTPSSPGTVGFQAMQNPIIAAAHLPSAIAGRDLGYLRTTTGCYISVAEVNEQYINYPGILNQCRIGSRSKHWFGSLLPQYARKDCYACPSLGCSSENLGSVPFVDLECWTIGETVRGSPLWVKNKEKNCYFPGPIFDERGWAGTTGPMCNNR